MIEHEDDELRTSFRGLRDDDIARAPDFHSLTQGAKAPVIGTLAATRRWRRSVPLIVAAATLLLVLGIARQISRHTHTSGAASSGTIATITTWRSPTQDLLRTSGRELLAPAPLLSSVLGDIPPVPIPRKGD